MLGLFESRKKKNMQEFIHHLDFMHMIILESLKKDFPEEVLWFLNTVNDKKIKDSIPSVVVSFYTVLNALPVNKEKYLYKELNKNGLLNEMDIQGFANLWSTTGKDYFPDGKISSANDIMNFAVLIIGEYLCAMVELNYAETNQAYNLSEEFSNHLGSLLFVEFNKMLELIENI